MTIDNVVDETQPDGAVTFAQLCEYSNLCDAPFEEALRRGDAQPLFKAAAEACAAHEVAPKVFAVHTMDDVHFITKHKGTENAMKFLASTRPAIPSGYDGEPHKKYRRMLEPVFAPRRMESLAPQVRELALSMIDEFIDDGQADVFDRWCEPLPASIFLSIMGLPREDLPDFFKFKRLILNNRAEGVSVEERARLAAEGTAWVQNYFLAEFRRRRDQHATDRQDVIGWLMSAEVDGETLSEDDMLDVLGTLMIAGLDTVAASLANMLTYLAQHPEQRGQIIADPGLIPRACEEMMRWYTPASHAARYILEDMTLPSGTTMPAGSVAFMFLASANMDPTIFADPLTVDFHREGNRHVAFSVGAHRCLGQPLARVEMRVALEAWHERIQDYRLADDADLRYGRSPRAPETLPLVWSVS